MQVIAIIAALFAAGNPGEIVEYKRNGNACLAMKFKPRLYYVECEKGAKKGSYVVEVGDKTVTIEVQK